MKLVGIFVLCLVIGLAMPHAPESDTQKNQLTGEYEVPIGKREDLMLQKRQEPGPGPVGKREIGYRSGKREDWYRRGKREDWYRRGKRKDWYRSGKREEWLKQGKRDEGRRGKRYEGRRGKREHGSLSGRSEEGPTEQD